MDHIEYYILKTLSIKQKEYETINKDYYESFLQKVQQDIITSYNITKSDIINYFHTYGLYADHVMFAVLDLKKEIIQNFYDDKKLSLIKQYSNTEFFDKKIDGNILFDLSKYKIMDLNLLTTLEQNNLFNSHINNYPIMFHYSILQNNLDLTNKLFTFFKFHENKDLTVQCLMMIGNLFIRKSKNILKWLNTLNLEDKMILHHHILDFQKNSKQYYENWKDDIYKKEGFDLFINKQNIIMRYTRENKNDSLSQISVLLEESLIKEKIKDNNILKIKNNRL
ncbi:TPA: hypothetical protein NV714_004892 [Escherichia coli]|nr:hypothetical protein [Escherichia coli]